MDEYVSAIIVCAGNSLRMGTNLSKQLIPLAGKPVIAHTIRAFEHSEKIRETIIVCRQSDKPEFENIIEKNEFKKISAIVYGGKTRSESVQNGIAAINRLCTHIAIHDGARPLITAADIDAVVCAGISCGAAALGVSLKDTIKEVDDRGNVLSTPNREDFRAIQTPQVFEKSLLKLAYEKAATDKKSFTDDCAVVEYYGAKVEIILGNEGNIKITTPTDILFAESLLKAKTKKL